MSFNEIGPSGAGALGSVFKHVNLVSLNLRCNELGPAGGKLIAKNLRDCSDTLKILILADNHIGQAAASLVGQNFKGNTSTLLTMFGHKTAV
jgi:Ran GTPase-activating protein (RanGAP) involved in mRNA processing and transport